MSDVTTREAKPLTRLASEANEHHRAAEEAARSALEHGRRAGEALEAAKAKVEHGEWTPWLEDNFEASPRTARLYMRVARNWSELETATENGNALPIREAAGLLAEPREEGRGEFVTRGSGRRTDNPYEVEEQVTDDGLLAGAEDPRAEVTAAILAEIRRVAPGTRFTPVGMELPEGLSFEDWLRVGELLTALPGADPELVEGFEAVQEEARAS